MVGCIAAAQHYSEDEKMFKVEFMILYLAEIAMAAFLLLAVSFLVWLVSVSAGWIKKILKKGGTKHGKSK